MKSLLVIFWMTTTLIVAANDDDVNPVFYSSGLDDSEEATDASSPAPNISVDLRLKDVKTAPPLKSCCDGYGQIKDTFFYM